MVNKNLNQCKSEKTICKEYGYRSCFKLADNFSKVALYKVIDKDDKVSIINGNGEVLAENVYNSSCLSPICSAITGDRNYTFINTQTGEVIAKSTKKAMDQFHNLKYVMDLSAFILDTNSKSDKIEQFFNLPDAMLEVEEFRKNTVKVIKTILSYRAKNWKKFYLTQLECKQDIIKIMDMVKNRIVQATSKSSPEAFVEEIVSL